MSVGKERWCILKVGDLSLEMMVVIKNSEKYEENGKFSKVFVKEVNLLQRYYNIVDVVEEVMEDIYCCVKVWDKISFKVFVFLVVLMFDVVDLFFDWLLFRDVFVIQEGFVYGFLDDVLIYVLFVFFIFGIFIFIFEVVNFWWEIFWDNFWVDFDFVFCIIIWIEDVFQIVINVLIVLCREEVISYFQFVKVFVLIVGVVIRIIVFLVKYCLKKYLEEVKKKIFKFRCYVVY